MKTQLHTPRAIPMAAPGLPVSPRVFRPLSLRA